jgi:predicted nuclease with RNAse H fold
MLAGIDYGSKLSGTTVICYGQTVSNLKFANAPTKQDADKYIMNMLTDLMPDIICIDAPLSLPGIYAHLHEFNDYFYRDSDKKLHAMSPMFLGGLTARAMKIKSILNNMNIPVLETYPAALVKHLELAEHYIKKDKTKINSFLQMLMTKCEMEPNLSQIKDWHHVDALLCWMSANRITNQLHLTYGNIDEGVIMI